MNTATFLSERGYLTISSMVLYLAEHHPTKAVSYPTLKRYIEKGYLRYVKVGGQYRLTKESIDHFVQYGTDPTPIDPDGEKVEGAQMLPSLHPLLSDLSESDEPEEDLNKPLIIPILE